MSIEQKINEDFMTAFKEKKTEVKLLLSTVKSDIQNSKKNLKVDQLSDDETIKILNKFAKNLRENVKLGDENSKSELEIIESYLPKLMTEDEVSKKIDEILSLGISNIGQIMKEFAQLPVDKKMVSDIAKVKMSK